MIELKDIGFKYNKLSEKKGEHFELKDISLKIEKGYISCLLGKNGAGKTTLLSLIYGLLKPSSGEILWNGETISKKNLAGFRRSTSFVGGRWCIDGMTVEHNAEMLSTLYPSFDRDYFDMLMKVAGAERIRDSLFGGLSKGEKVKAEICFMLARRPEIIILDEPLANIDPVFKTDILELLQKAVSENEIGVFLSTHLVDEISEMVDYINVLKNGQMVMSGSRFEILGDDEGKSLRELMKG